MSSSTEKRQTIIDLNKVLHNGDVTEIKRMEIEFETNGWCFVLLPTEVIPQSNLINKLEDFFSVEQSKG